MDPRHRSRVAFGFLLVWLGAWFLALQFVPGLAAWLGLGLTWSLIIAGAVMLLLFSIVKHISAMAVPLCFIGGIGLLLYWMDATNHWESWAYTWPLGFGFVGVGIILSALLRDRRRESIASGVRLVVVSAVLFIIFAGLLGDQSIFGRLWPLLLIGLGGFVLALSFRRLS